MYNKKILGILFISLILFSSLTPVIAEDRDYSIENYDIFLDILPNGLLHINESISYNFNGEFNGIYRDIPLKEGESIGNIEISLSNGIYGTYELLDTDEGKEIKVYLYSDAAMTQPIKDTSVSVFISYDMVNVTKIYSDTGEVQFKLWGDEWDQNAREFSAHIQFPSDAGVEYWINPFNAQVNQSWNGNILNIESNQLYSSDYLEFRSAIPLSEFSNAEYARHIDEPGLNEIHKIQDGEAFKSDLNNALSLIAPGLLVLFIICFVGVYVKFGREPKVNYNGIYEREPPSDDAPLIVNAMYGKGNVGTINEDGFQAVIMDLIDRKILSFSDEDNKLNLKLTDKYNPSELEDYERDVIRLIRGFEVDGVIDLNSIEGQLSSSMRAQAFLDDFNLFKSDFKALHVEPIMDELFDDNGYTYMLVSAIIGLAVAIILSIVTFVLDFSYLIYYAMAPLIIISAICLFLPNTFAGRWTEEGMLKHKQWDNFKKYLNDFSLIKEYPPESIVIWNKYLVYATALGVADNVQKAMKELVPESYIDDDELYRFRFYGGYMIFASSFSTASSTVSPDSPGGVGGGSGGGGGGAF